ncbi:MAG: cbb3-type cytochrome oxidase assembly protein CcoS [Gammaproteobacteria bacterium]|nr:cbb3-type cytochrome oxidase assembly protein CcoS [Gammaproteobacteria bacterium]
MEILYLLIPLAMVLLVIIAGFFFWSVKSGQMDDLEGPAYRILMDDDTVQKNTQSQSKPGAAAEPEQPAGKVDRD